MTSTMVLSGVVVLVCLSSTAWCQTMPPTPPPQDLETELTNHGGYSQILSLLRTTGLLDVLKNADNITLFAPTDAALARVPADQLAALTANPDQLKRLLGYHAVLEDVKMLHRKGVSNRIHDVVLTSSNNLPIRINVYRLVHTLAAEGVNVTERAIHVANGYVHGIDGVMMPPEGDVVEIAVKTPELSTLVSLLTSAGLVDVIKADMNLTVFAPTNDAFNKVNPAVLSYLTAHPKDMQEVLLYHVIEKQTLYSIGMKHTMTFPSADGRHDNLMILEDFTSGDISVNTARIIQKDISATNGVVHLIDEVLVPARILIKIEDSGAIVG